MARRRTAPASKWLDEWWAETDPLKLIDRIQESISWRSHRLLCCAMCRTVEWETSECEELIRTAEKFADDPSDKWVLDMAMDAAPKAHPIQNCLFQDGWYQASFLAENLFYHYPISRETLCSVIRAIAPPPGRVCNWDSDLLQVGDFVTMEGGFLKKTLNRNKALARVISPPNDKGEFQAFDFAMGDGLQMRVGTSSKDILFRASWKDWREGLIMKTARDIYDGADWSATPILADMVMDAGTPDPLIVQNLQGHGCKGMWSIDYLLGFTDTKLV